MFDGVTKQPIPGVCVIAGTASCGPGKPHTDASGVWSADVPLGTPTLLWDVRFQKAGYFVVGRNFVLFQGQTVTYVVYLQPLS